MDEHRLELKVGLLIVLAVAGCAALLFLLGELRFTAGARMTVQFAHTGGVPEGAPVKFAGVRVGRVVKLKLLPGRRDAEGLPLPVDMELEIDKTLFDDLGTTSRFVVATAGPLGEPFLEIDPGPASAKMILPGAVVRGTDPPRMDLLTSKLFGFVDEATKILGNGGDAKSVVSQIGGLAEKADRTLDEARPQVLAAVQDLSEAAKELKGLAHTASGMLGEKGTGRAMINDLAAVSAQLRKDVPAIAERAQKAADGAAAVAGTLTPEDGARLKEAIVRYEKAGASLGEVAAKADRLLGRIEAGEGTLGGLSKDPAVYDDLKSLVTDLKKHPWKVLWKD
jgi:phospholipid/cholesterol/gamma-HCH transport system substrate-binding protein